VNDEPATRLALDKNWELAAMRSKPFETKGRGGPSGGSEGIPPTGRRAWMPNKRLQTDVALVNI
jgi:hypothetical protein